MLFPFSCHSLLFRIFFLPSPLLPVFLLVFFIFHIFCFISSFSPYSLQFPSLHPSDSSSSSLSSLFSSFFSLIYFTSSCYSLSCFFLFLLSIFLVFLLSLLLHLPPFLLPTRFSLSLSFPSIYLSSPLSYNKSVW